MLLWLRLGALIAFAVLGAVCWHRGAVIDDLYRQIGSVEFSNDQLRKDLDTQNGAVAQLGAERVELDKRLMAAEDAAHKTRVIHDAVAQKILVEKPVESDACKEAERLMDEHHEHD